MQRTKSDLVFVKENLPVDFVPVDLNGWVPIESQFKRRQKVIEYPPISCRDLPGYSAIARGLLLLTLIVPSSGCQQQPAHPKVDLSVPRPANSFDTSKLKFPEGFPTSIKLYKPTWIGVQDSQQKKVGSLTWDIHATAAEVREYYIEEFTRLGFQPCIKKIRDLPGNNFRIEIFNPEYQRVYGISIGQFRKGPVKGFIGSKPSSLDSWLRSTRPEELFYPEKIK